jgi:hypothetical protein
MWNDMNMGSFSGGGMSGNLQSSAGGFVFYGMQYVFIGTGYAQFPNVQSGNVANNGPGKAPNNDANNSTQKPSFWNYVRKGTFCTDTVNAAEKAGYIGGGIFVVGTGLDATGIAIPAGVAMQAYGADVMAVSTTIGAAAQIGKAFGICH